MTPEQASTPEILAATLHAHTEALRARLSDIARATDEKDDHAAVALAAAAVDALAALENHLHLSGMRS